ERSPEEPTERRRARERERPKKDEEFADEAVEARQPERGQDEHAEECREERPHVRESAQVRDHPPMRLLVLDADEEEERAGDEAVVEHLQHRADAALQVEDEDAERDETHVRYG